MKLQGLHHITMITGDAPKNVEFYADVLGLRLVKKTVNFDAPDAYHLYFGDEQGTPGTILTWFEFAGAPRGRAGAGMIHTLQLAVADEAALDQGRDQAVNARLRPQIQRILHFVEGWGHAAFLHARMDEEQEQKHWRGEFR